MDIEKLIRWGTEYFSEYVSVFVLTLTRPTTRFEPVANQTKQSILSDKALSAYSGPNLNPRLFGFLLISIFIGATLNSIVPARPRPADMVTTAIVTVAFWFAYSCLIFGVCKLLGGKGSFWESLSVSLQLLAVIYVVSNFATLLLAVFVRLPFVHNLLTGRNLLLDVFTEIPISFYYVVQFILMFVYLPFALKYVHGFTFVRQIFASVIPIVVGTTCAISMFFQVFIVLPLPSAPPRPTPHRASPTNGLIIVPITAIPIQTPTASSTPRLTP